MQGFFAGDSHGRSEILRIQRSGDFIHAVEKAIWSAEGEEPVQSCYLRAEGTENSQCLVLLRTSMYR